MPLFSIITICYNEESRISRTLESVFTQNHDDYEHIIIDGMSTDNSINIIRKSQGYYKKNQLKIYSEQDTGIYDAMNNGLKKACGEYICFMNSGDRFFDVDILKKVAEIIDKEKADIYYGDTIAIYPNNEINYITMMSCDNNQEVAKLARKAFRKKFIKVPHHQATFAHRRCFEDNIFDLQYKLRAEFNWFMKCYERNLVLYYMKLPICYFESGGTSDKAENALLTVQEMDRIIYGFYEHDETAKEQISKLMRQYANAKVESRILGNWLTLKSSGLSMVDYFYKNNINEIAVYGIGILGNHFIREIRNSKISIKYIIDKNVRDAYLGVKTVSVNEELLHVDAIIVTPVFQYNCIKETLIKKIQCPIISLEEVLEEAWK